MLAYQTPQRVLVHVNSQGRSVFLQAVLCRCQCRRGTSEYFRVVAHLHSCRVFCVVVDDGVPVGACSSHVVSAPLSQQVQDVDYSYQMRSNTELSQLRVTVPAGHNGALVGRSEAERHYLF